MAIVITWQTKYADLEPEVNRSRCLYFSAMHVYDKEKDGNNKCSNPSAAFMKECVQPVPEVEYLSLIHIFGAGHYNTICQSGCSSYREVGVRGIAAVGSLAGGIHQFAVGGIQFLSLIHILSHSWADVGKLRYVPQTPFGYKSFSGRYVHGVISGLLSRRAKAFRKGRKTRS